MSSVSTVVTDRLTTAIDRAQAGDYDGATEQVRDVLVLLDGELANGSGPVNPDIDVVR